ncbi:ester cyclase [Salinigranum rubrum]|nr:ester cyclase [Salinigranum rubrum]
MVAIAFEDNTELHVNIEAEELWSEGNTDVLDEYYTDDFVYHGPDGDLDMDGYRTHASEFREAFPDCHVAVHETVLDGDLTVARFTYSGTWEGTFRGMESNGSSFSVDGISMARIEDGKFAEIWRYTDRMAMMTQLGLVDLPA